MLYDIQKLLTESLCGNSKAIQNVCELIKNGKKWQHCQVCHFTGAKFIGGNKKKECPIQKSNLGSTSSVWSICCSLGWTTQSDLAAQVNIVFLWGEKKCKDVDVNCFPD